MNNLKNILILDADYDEGVENTALMIREVLHNVNVDIVRVCDGNFPDSLNYGGFIVNGSRASFDDNEDWIEELMELIFKIHISGKPLLGICFGHQLIANVLGGVVEHMDNRCFGYNEIMLSNNAKLCKLFLGFGDSLFSFFTHEDEVTDLPAGASLLASNKCIQAFCIGNSYGIQFHPEMAFEEIITLARERGLDLEKIKKDSLLYGERPALQVLLNFEKIVIG